MTQAGAEPLARAQSIAGAAATAALVGAGLIALAGLAGEVDPALTALRTREITPDLSGVAVALTAIGVFTLMAMPSLLLAGALLDLGKVLDAYAKGAFFTAKSSAGVRKAGEGALWALGFKVVGTPTLVSWITHEGRGVIWRLEAFDIGLIAFAAFVMVLGHVLEAAAHIKAENDEII